jgi:hypothetical protein
MVFEKCCQVQITWGRGSSLAQGIAIFFQFFFQVQITWGRSSSLAEGTAMIRIPGMPMVVGLFFLCIRSLMTLVHPRPVSAASLDRLSDHGVEQDSSRTSQEALGDCESRTQGRRTKTKHCQSTDLSFTRGGANNEPAQTHRTLLPHHTPTHAAAHITFAAKLVDNHQPQTLSLPPPPPPRPFAGTERGYKSGSTGGLQLLPQTQP